MAVNEIIAFRAELSKQLRRQCGAAATCDNDAKSLVHRGRRGVFRNGGPYVLSALANGGYEDQERPDGATYLFPQSHQPSLDALDIVAADDCLRDGIPIFYVQRVAVGPARYRIFYPARIAAIDHEHQAFHIVFRGD